MYLNNSTERLQPLFLSFSCQFPIAARSFYPQVFNNKFSLTIFQQYNNIVRSFRRLQDLKDLISNTGRAGEQYGEHSGRRGGATAAEEAGAKWADLKKLGRWASGTAPQLYIKNTEQRRSELSLMLAAAAQAHSEAGSQIRTRYTIITDQGGRRRQLERGEA